MPNSFLKFFKRTSQNNYIIFCTVTICSITLFGWIFDIQILENFSSSNFWIKMLPISAIAMILSSFVIYLKEVNKFKKTSIAILCILLFLGVSTVINSLTKTDILQLRVLGIVIDPKISVHISSIEFVLLNFSILFLFSSKKSLHLISEILASITFFIAAVFFIGYTYGIGKMQYIIGFSSIAIQTTICLLLLSFLLLKLNPQKKILGVFLEQTNVSRVSGKYLLFVFFLIFFIGRVSLWGERMGYYSTEVGLGIMMLIFMIACFIIVREGVIVINQKEQEKSLSELQIKTNLDRVNLGFFSLDDNWCYRYVNSFAAEVLNSNPTELIGKNMLEEYPEVKGHIFHTCCIQALNSKKHVHFESYYPPFKKWFEYNIYPTANALSIFFSDITERKEITESMLVFNERFNLISKATNEALWENNLITGELWANEIHQNLYGLTINDPVPDEVEWLKRVHPDDREKIKTIHHQNSEEKENIFTCEYRFLAKNNQYINIYDRVYYVRNEEGVPIKTMGNMMDITHLKEIEHKLEESQNHLRTILDTEPQCIKLLNKDGQVLDMNIKGLEMVEANCLNDILNLPIVGILKKEYQTNFNKSIKEVFNGKTVHLQFEIIGFKGTHRWLESHAVPFYNKERKITALLAVTSDITQRKLIELDLEKSYNSVRELTHHLQNIREEERVIISREIHDELGQYLVAMKMDIAWLNKKLNKSDILIQQKIDDVLELISEMIKSVRKISHNLRPYSLSDFGLDVAVEQYYKEFEIRSNIKTNFSYNVNHIEIIDEVKTTLYRIIQESFTNIAKHSKAKNVSIQIFNSENNIILKIEDDGIGFNIDTLPTKKTLGIIGMKERANILGGTYQIKSEKDKGTSIEVTIPN